MSLPNTAEIEAVSLLAWPAVETLHDGDVAEGFTADLAALRQAGWPLRQPVAR